MWRQSISRSSLSLSVSLPLSVSFCLFLSGSLSSGDGSSCPPLTSLSSQAAPRITARKKKNEKKKKSLWGLHTEARLLCETPRRPISDGNGAGRDDVSGLPMWTWSVRLFPLKWSYNVATGGQRVTAGYNQSNKVLLRFYEPVVAKTGKKRKKEGKTRNKIWIMYYVITL